MLFQAHKNGEVFELRKDVDMPEKENHYLKTELDALFGGNSNVLTFLNKLTCDGVWYWDLENPEVEWMSPGYWTSIGYDPKDKQHLASEWQSLVDPEGLKMMRLEFDKHCQNPDYPYDITLRYRHQNGSTSWIRCQGCVIKEHGRPVRMLGFHINITEQKLLEQRNKKNLSAMDELYAFTKLALEESETVFDSSPEAILQIDDQGFIVRCNQAAVLLFGYKKEELADRNVDILVPNEFKLAHAKNIKDYQVSPVTRMMTAKDRVIFAVKKNGVRIHVEIRLNPITTRLGQHVLATIRDVTEYQQLINSLRETLAENERLAIDASTDPLTKLYNRRYYQKNADREFANSRRYNNELSLILIDIDHFKRVNDLRGHDVGDLVLQQVAKSAMEVIRTGDTLARYGGEEFVVLLPMTSSNAAEVLAERIRQQIDELCIQIESTPSFGITVSAGIATRHKNDNDIDEILHRADEALYQAKSQGRNRVIVIESIHEDDTTKPETPKLPE